MKTITLLALLAVLTGCSSLGGTVAGGTLGNVDYCVDFGIIDPICVKASRTAGPAE